MTGFEFVTFLLALRDVLCKPRVVVGLQVLEHTAGTLVAFEVKRFIDPQRARVLQASLFERRTLRYLMPLPL